MKKATALLAAVLGMAALTVVAVSCDGNTPDDNGLGDGRKISRLTQVGKPNAIDEYDRLDRVCDFEYDDRNRLVKITASGFELTDVAEIRFAYAGDRVTVTGISESMNRPMICDDNGNCEGGESYVGATTIEVQLNAGGYIASGTTTVVWDHDLPNSVGTTTATYDAEGYLTGLAFSEGQSNGNHLSLAWTAGNLTRVQESSSGSYSVAQYTASPNKANLDLNWLVYSDSFFALGGFQWFAYAGLLGRRNLNLVAQTAEHCASDVCPYRQQRAYNYTFDPDGYVTQWTTGDPNSPDATPAVFRVEYRQ